MFLNNENKGVLTVASFAITQMANAGNSLYEWQSIELAFKISFLACTRGMQMDFLQISQVFLRPSRCQFALVTSSN
jgi:hypothetical protein